MRFAPKEDDIIIGQTGFEENDILGRQAIGKELSERLERFEDPIVVALDNGWGTGKSYFLKRWVGAHMNEPEHKAQTLYFDAFEHDYMTDPLVALVSALTETLSEEKGATGQKLKNIAIKLAKPGTRIALAAATSGISACVEGIYTTIAEGISDETSKAIDQIWAREQSRKAAMEEFRAALKELTANGEKPLIIVVDELDRCRPDYALELLEIIKHFFSVDRVHFVLGVNLKALENSVKARYGAEIDASAYLQKFLSFTMSLPDTARDPHRTPVLTKYLRHFGQRMGLDSDLLTDIVAQTDVLRRANNISLRDAGKILSTAALLPDEAYYVPVAPIQRYMAITLIITKVIRPDFYPRLAHADFTKTELIKYIGIDEETADTGPSQLKGLNSYTNLARHLYVAWAFLISGSNFGFRKLHSEFLDTTFGPDVESRKVRPIIQQNAQDWLSTFNIPSTTSDPKA